MEKKKPHYTLSAIREAVGASRARITVTALQDAHGLGFAEDRIWEVVCALRSADFYKSMTTKADHRVWQDVYRPRVEGMVLYVKIQKVTAEYWVISFKRK